MTIDKRAMPTSHARARARSERNGDAGRRPSLLTQDLPARLSREGRIGLLVTAARALCEGAPIPTDAARYLGGALLDWLDRGGRLEHDHLRVVAPAGSHRTPSAIVREIASSRGALDAEDSDIMGP